LSFNGQQLSAADPSKFQSTLTGSVSAGEFVLKDNKGNTFINKIALPAPIAMPGLDEVNYPVRFKWIGAPVNEVNQSVVVSVSFPPQPTPAHTTISSLTYTEKRMGVDTVLIVHGVIRNLNCTGTLSRVKEGTISQSTNGGSTIRSIYVSKEDVFFVKPSW
jgi:hypothetical protein